MAGRSFVQLLGAADPGVVLLGISFTPNGTGTIAASDINGRGVASVAWSTDRYVVTLQDQYASLLAANVSLQLANPAAAKMFGHPVDALIGMPIERIIRLSADDAGIDAAAGLLRDRVSAGDSILVKASRASGLERLVAAIAERLGDGA